MHSIIELVFLLSSFSALISASFTLTQYRQHDCLAGTSTYVCFNVGYGYCCERRMRHDPQLLRGFLSMAQSSPQSGDIQIVHAARGSQGCGGTVVGSDNYGCADASTGIAFGGMVHHCFGTCNKRDLPICKGVVQADAVFYKDLAYESYPKDDRLGDLVEKMMEDEPFLTDEELKELEPVRMPWADIAARNTTSTASNTASAEAKETSQ